MIPESTRIRWSKLAQTRFNIQAVRQLAVQGLLEDYHGLRSVLWRLFFGILPEPLESDFALWRNIMTQKRVEYESLRNVHITDPRKLECNANLALDNPLSLDQESPWRRHFENDQLKKLIMQDVVRTFPEIEFYRQEDVRESLCNILFIYSIQNYELSYRQGMHELAAIIYFILHEEYIHQDFEKETTDLNVLECLLDCRFMEHDAYLLFESMMKAMKSWYEYGRNDVQPEVKNSFDKTFSEEQPFSSKKVDSTSSAGEVNKTPIVRKLERIQKVILKRVDPALCAHLQELNIEPQIYGIRWLRLLFAREFVTSDLVLLWDAIFAEDPKTFSITDWVVVALLLERRQTLMSDSTSICLQELMKSAFVENPTALVQHAFELRSRFDDEQLVLLSAAYATPKGELAVHKRDTAEKQKGFFSDLRRSISPFSVGKVPKQANSSPPEKHGEFANGRVMFETEIADLQHSLELLECVKHKLDDIEKDTAGTAANLDQLELDEHGINPWNPKSVSQGSHNLATQKSASKLAKCKADLDKVINNTFKTMESLSQRANSASYKEKRQFSKPDGQPQSQGLVLSNETLTPCSSSVVEDLFENEKFSSSWIKPKSKALEDLLK